MDGLSRYLLSYFGALAINVGIGAGLALAQGVIYMVPAGEDPNAYGDGPTVIDASGLQGGSIAIQHFVRDVPVPISAFLEAIACVNDTETRGSINYHRGSGKFDVFRPDFIFAFLLANRRAVGSPMSSVGVDESTCPGGVDPQPDGTVQFSGVTSFGGADISDGTPRYAGEFVLDVSADACGELPVPFLSKSVLRNSNLAQISNVIFQNLLVTVGPSNDFAYKAPLVWDGELEFNTSCATTDGPTGCPLVADIWYAWTASCAGTLIIDAVGAQIGVYGPDLVGTPTDADELACSLDTSNSVDVRPGETYLIRLGTFDGSAHVGTLGITVEPMGRYGDLVGTNGTCGPDDIIDLNDVLAVLNGFAGIFPKGCDLHHFDIAGDDGSCVPNGIVDLSDILAVLSAFEGLDPCCAGRP